MTKKSFELDRHKRVLTEILIDIIKQLNGKVIFKGGTAAMMFYNFMGSIDKRFPAEDLPFVWSKRWQAYAAYNGELGDIYEKMAGECAQIFQRSSSCVEGRNAQLSLRHHGIHRLSNKCLKAQTIIHNYYTRNRDGTTPAERLFDSKHADLFGWLLEKMDYPARPRNHLKKAA